MQLRWAGQHRSGSIGWLAALATHGGGMLLGAAWTVFAWWLRPLYFHWSLPVSLPLILAPAVSVLTSRASASAMANHRVLLRTPEETREPDVVRTWEQNLVGQAPATGDGD